MGATSETRTYNTHAALALDKVSDQIADAVSTGTPAFDQIRRKGNWKGVSSGGEKRKVPIMHTLIPLQPVGSFGTGVKIGLFIPEGKCHLLSCFPVY